MKKEKQQTLKDSSPTFAEIRKILKETTQIMKEDKRQMREERKQIREEQLNFKKRIEHLDKLYEQTREQIGGISRSNGEFCEEYFINSFKENPTLFGEKYDRVMAYLIPNPVVINDEYDLVLQNGTTTALIEMKYKAGTDDVGKMFSKLHSYRANYPMFKDYKIYLCLASFRFSKVVRDRAAKEGIVLIEQRGDKIEVISEHVRAW